MNFKKVALLFILGICTISSSCKKKDDEINTNKNFQESIQKVADSIYEDFYDRWGIEQGGVHVYISGPSGEYQASSNITPAPSAATHFRVASISKTFTAAAIMLLHQQGDLNINDLITSYLPSTPTYDFPNRDQITIKQLIQHRSGVFDVSNNDIPDTINAPYAGDRYESYIKDQDEYHTFTFDEISGLISSHQLRTAEPDEGFFYSNTGYALLGKIIEEVSGLSYSEFIDQKFAIPLGLTGTYSPWDGNDTEMRTPYIDSYLHLVGVEILETPEDNVSLGVGSGNIVSTPQNITKWMRLLLKGEAGINSTNVALMKEMLPADAGHGVYGLGLVFDEGLGFGHNGIHKSHVSSLRYNPDNDITILVSANFIRFDPNDNNSVFDLGYAVRDAMLPVVKAYLK